MWRRPCASAWGTELPSVHGIVGTRWRKRHRGGAVARLTSYGCFCAPPTAVQTKKPGHDEEDNPPLLDDPFLRKITTFKETSRDIIFAEENILPNLPYPINDAFFVYDDVTGNRHMGQSEVAYLDGHSDDIPPAIVLFRDRRYYPR